MKHCLLASVLAIAVALSAAPALAAPVVVKLGHDLSEDTPQHLGSMKFKEIVEQKTGGAVKVEVFPSNQLGNDRETTEFLQTGSVQAALIPTAKLSLFAPALQLPDLPFFFPTREITYKFLDSELGYELLAQLESKGIRGVAFWESGFKQFTANKELKSPDDFKGMKFRVMESPILIEQFKALGANPVPIDFGETYNALQQKVVDGQENPLVSIVRMRFHEVQTNTVISNHGYLAYGFLFSKRWLDRQPAEVQTILIEAAREVASFQREETVRREQGFIETIEKSGCKVTYLTPEQKKIFADATRPVHQKFETSIGKGLMEKAYKKIAELEKQ
ncbi:MAG: TRAP transporter substrate-binding protein [Deltaproteobacteria bacterium]|nr:TRAP transporter substrate-binding protein [Deltaproteobacteria bacterium]